MSRPEINGDSAKKPPWQQDRLRSLLLPDHDARLLLVDASGTAFEAEFRHLCGRVSAEILARAAAGAVLLGADLKGDERLAIQVRCEGPIEGYLVEVDATLSFRGYTHKKALPGLDRSARRCAEGIGTVGRLQVIRSTGSGTLYQGITNLAAGDVASDLEKSLLESQQVPSRLLIDHGYGAQLVHAVGLLIQGMPGADPGRFAELANAVAERAEHGRPWTRDLAALTDHVLPDAVARKVLHERPVSFSCRCSRSRAISVLRLVGPPEGETAYPAESRVTCAFCNDTYVVLASEIASSTHT
jgi:molecular chaperone Hsp33